jgi:DNA-binding CsgD family transcriptional regulator
VTWPWTPEGEWCGVAEGEVGLSPRQREVLGLVAEGATDHEIARRLRLSVDTVAWHMREIRARLGARSRAHAVALAIGHGLLPSPPSPEEGHS